MQLRSEIISSNQNPKIKNLIQLQKHNERKKQNLFIIEGIKEIEKAVQANYAFESLFYCRSISGSVDILSKIPPAGNIKLYEVRLEIYNRIAYRQNSGGIIALARPKIHSISTLNFDRNPLILVIEGVEKPGNIGAIFRTADAAGVSAIIICDPGTDLYNPNAVRASLGCIFTIPTAICSSSEAIQFLKNHGIKIFTSYLKASIPYYKADFTLPSAIVMGTEATGVSESWVKNSDANIIIPMRGIADSMNVSTATAVLIFEARRQRDFK